jgi:hypothetical protein
MSGFAKFVAAHVKDSALDGLLEENSSLEQRLVLAQEKIEILRQLIRYAVVQWGPVDGDRDTPVYLLSTVDLSDENQAWILLNPGVGEEGIPLIYPITTNDFFQSCIRFSVSQTYIFEALVGDFDFYVSVGGVDNVENKLNVHFKATRPSEGNAEETLYLSGFIEDDLTLGQYSRLSGRSVADLTSAYIEEGGSEYEETNDRENYQQVDRDTLHQVLGHDFEMHVCHVHCNVQFLKQVAHLRF